VFTVSSAFPVVAATYYLPKPYLPVPGFEDPSIRETYAKLVKKTSFVDRHNFGRWVNGETLDFDLLAKEWECLQNAVATRARPRVSLDRVSQASGLFFVGETLFSDRAALYFVMECWEQDFPALRRAITMLGEEGIGGERSCGYGKFVPAFDTDFELPRASAGNAFCILSLFYPKHKKEVVQNTISFRLVPRSGWLESPYCKEGRRHRRVLMFAEGSVFRQKVEGELVDVAPGNFKAHPVYRNGRALGVEVVARETL